MKNVSKSFMIVSLNDKFFDDNLPKANYVVELL
jgi:hypothetical protein